MTWAEMIRDGLAMKHGKDLTWNQILLGANTPCCSRRPWWTAVPISA